MNRFRVAAALGVFASSLLGPIQTLAFPITAMDPVNNPLLLQINAASGGPFGGGPIGASQGVGNWVWSIEVTENNNVGPDVLAVGVKVTHNVKPPGADHVNDADKGPQLSLDFKVTAGNPSTVDPASPSNSLGHQTSMGAEHSDSARLTSLIPVVNLATNDIISWTFTVVADHSTSPVRTPEPSVLLLLLASGVMGLLYKRVRGG
jgi:hypothetical protein